MRSTLIVAGIVLLACSACKTKEGVPENSALPNIVLIISDDQAWTDYSFLGHPYIETPRLDQLAAEGLTFTRGYATAPLCRPSLASMVTGLYPHQSGRIGNDPVVTYEGSRWGKNWMENRIPANNADVDAFEEITTLPDLLGEKGYLSMQTGKWWEGHYSRGGFTHGMTHGDPSRGARHGDAGLTIGREGLDTIYNFIDLAVEQEKPFFIWYAPFLPHAPHTPPDSLFQKYLPHAPTEPVAKYWAMCEWFDITCGQLIDHIDDRGLGENTLFVYVCDNGWIQDPDTPNRNAPRSKTSPYEGGVRTPMMFRWTGHINPKMDTVTMVSSIDMAPTVYAACGIEAPAALQGINVLDKETLLARKEIFCETYSHDYSTIDSSLQYRIIIANPWKLILPDPDNLPEEEVQLYNVYEDAFERNNLAAEHPDIVADLTARIEKWWLE